MSDVSPIRQPDKIELSADQRRALEEANGWVSSSMAALGETYLSYDEAKRSFERMEKKLESCKAAALHAERQRAQVVRAMAGMLDLSQGEWVYDGNGSMVRKDSSNG